jgi:hypothetical protein
VFDRWSLRLHLTVTTLSRVVALVMAAITAGAVVGSWIIWRRASSSLDLEAMYVALFAGAVLAWIVVALDLSLRSSSIAAAVSAVPAFVRAEEFLRAWIVDGTELPGVRIMGIVAWSGFGVLTVTVGVLLGVEAARRGRW